MGKFRSKLKRHNKGKNWGRGQSATSNPENTKYRSKAQSRFFQSNLNAAAETKPGSLTQSALNNHDAKQFYLAGKATTAPTVNDIAQSLHSFNIDGDGEIVSQSQGQTFKTYQTFASNYSACTNQSFSKLLNGFRADSDLHKEMLAILAALTEVIKQRGGKESSTEYFLALMETLDAANEDNEIIASLSLLNMGLRTVPEAILRKKFSDCISLLMDFIKRFVDSDNQNVLKNILTIIASLLRAQEYSIWTMTSTLEIFDTILVFTTHTKPKVRKAAQHSIAAIIHGSCFMRPEKVPDVDDGSDEAPQTRKVPYHPAGSRVAKFCCKQFKPENVANNQALILHTLGLLKDTMNGFKNDDIKTICESLLSIMTASNILIRTNCFQTIHSLFTSKSKNLTASLIGQLIAAIYEFRPEKHDFRETLAWLTVLKEGHICLAAYDISMCINCLPTLMDICGAELWISEREEIVTAASNVIKEIFLDCIKSGCETRQLADIHRFSIAKCIQSIHGGLSAPFGHTANQVILTFATVFQTTGKFFADELQPSLAAIGARYDVDSSIRLQIEHTVLAAIPTMGPENVLRAITLVDETTGDVSLNRSWILPLLREGIVESSIEFFINYILKLAHQCYTKWQKFKEANNFTQAHTHELLFCQLWGLFPGFCRRPIDIFNFRNLAKTLGMAINEKPEIRSSILDGLKELMVDVDEDGKNEIARFAKNFLPILFNVYATKPTISYENDVRKTTLSVIEEYLKISPQPLVNEMFATAKAQYDSQTPGTFTAEALYDVIKCLAVHQSADNLRDLFENFVASALQKTASPKVDDKTKWKRRKAYELIENILYNGRGECAEYVDANIEHIQRIIIKSGRINCKKTQAIRLNCIKYLIGKQQRSFGSGNLLKKLLPEIVKSYNVTAGKNAATLELLVDIGRIYVERGKLQEYVDALLELFSDDADSQSMNSNLIIVLKTVIGNFSGSLTVPTVELCLSRILQCLIGKNRTEVEASLAFLIGFIKTLPAPLVANHLIPIIKSLSLMVPDTKRHCRIHIGYILRKLCKKFTAEEIIKLVPGNDEITHKKLKNIRKEQNREKRKTAEAKDGSSDDDDDDDENSALKLKSQNIDDILDDSESELDDDMNGDGEQKTQKSKKGSSRKETYIQEDPEGILDLNDIRSIRHISSSKPQPQSEGDKSKSKAPKRDGLRGFKMAEDGRIIISEPKKGEATQDDSDDDEQQQKNNSTQGKKRTLGSDSDDDDDDVATSGNQNPSKSKRLRGAASVASGRTNVSGKYVAGGQGIHRQLSSGASTKSGTSRVSRATTKPASVVYGGGGSEYQSQKARGDVKRKGKVDPYAYIPLSRNLLNKRKRAKQVGEFKSIVRGARKGAAAGNRSKLHQINKKKK